MYLHLLYNDDDQTGTGSNDSHYIEPRTEGDLNADIVGVAKLRDALLKHFQLIHTATSSSSYVSAVIKDMPDKQQDFLHLFEKWAPDAWVQPYTGKAYYLIQSKYHVSSKQSSRQKDSSIPELITTIQTTSNLGFAGRLAARLNDLYESSQEEFPDQQPMSSRSLQDFLTLIRSVPGITHPQIVLTYEGNIRAEWTKSHTKHFAVEFLGDNRTKFVIFAPDTNNPYRINRVSGFSTLASLLEIAFPYNVLSWAVDNQYHAA